MLAGLAGTAGADAISRVDPTHYRSASGAFEWFVDPQRRDGTGSAMLTRSRDGQPDLHAGLPYTLIRAVVGEHGEMAGYAVTGSAHRDGALHLLVIGPDGELRRDEAITLEISPYIHGADWPYVRDLRLDAAGREVVFCVAVHQARKLGHETWRYRLEDGERVSDQADDAPCETWPTAPDAPPAVDPDEAWMSAPPEVVDPVLLGTLPIIAPAAQDADFPAQVDQFQWLDDGRLLTLSCPCGEAGPATLSVLDSSGHLLRRIELPQWEATSARWHLAWLEGGTAVVTASSFERDRPARAWLVDFDNATTQPLAGFDAVHVRALSGAGRGEFAALVETGERFAVVGVHDASGAARWRVEAGSGDDDPWLSPEALALSTAGQVWVLDNLRKRLTLHDQFGAPVRTIDLGTHWTEPPHYPTDVALGRDDTLWVVDFLDDQNHALLRMRSDGRALTRWVPHLPDGRRFDLLSPPQTDRHDQLWVSDGRALLRLDGGGKVTQSLGSLPDRQTLSRLAAWTVGPRRELYLADERSAAIHVRDEHGRTRRILLPAVDDYDGALQSPVLAVAADGVTLISHGRSRIDDLFLRYSPEGARIGTQTLPGEWLHALPGQTGWWSLSRTHVRRLDADGRIVRETERLPDGQWLTPTGAAAVAGDGSLAVVSGYRSHGWGWPPAAMRVALYSPSGEPLAQWPVPPGFTPLNGRISFDGRQLAFLLAEQAGAPSMILLVDPATRRLGAWRIDGLGDNASMQHVAGAAGDELWLFDGHGAIRRYVMP